MNQVNVPYNILLKKTLNCLQQFQESNVSNINVIAGGMTCMQHVINNIHDEEIFSYFIPFIQTYDIDLKLFTTDSSETHIYDLNVFRAKMILYIYNCLSQEYNPEKHILKILRSKNKIMNLTEEDIISEINRQHTSTTSPMLISYIYDGQIIVDSTIIISSNDPALYEFYTNQTFKVEVITLNSYLDYITNYYIDFDGTFLDSIRMISKIRHFANYVGNPSTHKDYNAVLKFLKYVTKLITMAHSYNIKNPDSYEIISSLSEDLMKQIVQIASLIERNRNNVDIQYYFTYCTFIFDILRTNSILFLELSDFIITIENRYGYSFGGSRKRLRTTFSKNHSDFFPKGYQKIDDSELEYEKDMRSYDGTIDYDIEKIINGARSHKDPCLYYIENVFKPFIKNMASIYKKSS